MFMMTIFIDVLNHIDSFIFGGLTWAMFFILLQKYCLKMLMY